MPQSLAQPSLCRAWWAHRPPGYNQGLPIGGRAALLQVAQAALAAAEQRYDQLQQSTDATAGDLQARLLPLQGQLQQADDAQRALQQQIASLQVALAAGSRAAAETDTERQTLQKQLHDAQLKVCLRLCCSACLSGLGRQLLPCWPPHQAVSRQPIDLRRCPISVLC